MRALGQQGKTVLVSSHILAEVEHVADTVSIIARGRLLASGTVADVIGSGHSSGFRVRVADSDAARLVMTGAGWQVRAGADGSDNTDHSDGFVVEGVADGAAITRLLAGSGLWVSELTPIRADLESVFLGSPATPAYPTPASRGGTGDPPRRRRAAPAARPPAHALRRFRDAGRHRHHGLRRQRPGL